MNLVNRIRAKREFGQHDHAAALRFERVLRVLNDKLTLVQLMRPARQAERVKTLRARIDRVSTLIQTSGVTVSTVATTLTQGRLKLQRLAAGEGTLEELSTDTINRSLPALERMKLFKEQHDLEEASADTIRRARDDMTMMEKLREAIRERPEQVGTLAKLVAEPNDEAPSTTSIVRTARVF